MDPTTLEYGNAYDFVWDSTNLGSLGEYDDFTTNLELLTHDVQVNSIGNFVLDRRVLALTGTIDVTLRQVTADLERKLRPWAVETGGYGLAPTAPNDGLYQYAQLLTLHPRLAGADTTRDLNFVKAAPWTPPAIAKGNENTVLNVTFHVFLDLSKLPAERVSCYVGEVPVVVP